MSTIFISLRATLKRQTSNLYLYYGLVIMKNYNNYYLGMTTFFQHFFTVHVVLPMYFGFTVYDLRLSFLLEVMLNIPEYMTDLVNRDSY